jgi:hypothetical protein
MKKTEFEFKRYRFDFKMPLLCDSPSLVSDQRLDILNCFAQLKEKTHEVISACTITKHADLEICLHLFQYYKLAMVEIDNSERRYQGLVDRNNETESTARFYAGKYNKVD